MNGRGDRRPVEVRLWARVVKTESCWVWTGSLSNGYGQIQDKGKRHPVHRFVYELLVGPIPEGMQLDHLCRNRACVRPAHLEPVTELVNIRRGRQGAAQRARTKCPQGHRYTEANTAHRRGRRHCRTCERDRATKARAKA